MVAANAKCKAHRVEVDNIRQRDEQIACNIHQLYTRGELIKRYALLMTGGETKRLSESSSYLKDYVQNAN